MEDALEVLEDVDEESVVPVDPFASLDEELDEPDEEPEELLLERESVL